MKTSVLGLGLPAIAAGRDRTRKSTSASSERPTLIWVPLARASGVGAGSAAKLFGLSRSSVISALAARSRLSVDRDARGDALAPLMKFWLAPVPSRLARPIVSVVDVRPVDVAGVDRDADRALAPLMKLWSTPVPSRLARPIVLVRGSPSRRGRRRPRRRAGWHEAADEALVDARAVEVGAADRARLTPFAQ